MIPPTPPDIQTTATAPPRSAPWRRVLRWATITVLASYFFLGAIFLLARYAVLPNLDRLTPVAESALSQRLGKPVIIENLSGHLEGPNLAISMASIRIGRDDEALPGGRSRAEGVAAVLSWRSILAAKPVFMALHIKEVQLSVERVSEQLIKAAGYPINLAAIDRRSDDHPADGRWRLPDWLLDPSDVRIESVRLDYHDLETGERAATNSMSVASSGQLNNRTLRVDIDEFEGLAGRLSLQARLGRDGKIGAANSGNWRGEAYLELNDFDAARLTRLGRGFVPIESGKMRVRAWFSLRDSRARSARLALSSGPVRLAVEGATLELQSLAADAETVWHANGDLEIRLLKARFRDRRDTEIALDKGPHRLTLDPRRRIASGRFSLREFDAAHFLAFARELPIADDLSALIAPLKADGRVRNMSLEFDARDARSRYRLAASFAAMSASYLPAGAKDAPPNQFSPRLPSIENLDGSVELTEREGRLILEGRDAAVSLPGVIARPRIPFESFDARIDWRLNSELQELTEIGTDAGANPADQSGRSARVPGRAGALDVFIRHANFANADGRGRLYGQYRTAKDSIGVVNLVSDLQEVNVRSVHHYLPLTILPKVRQWMRQALQAGQAKTAKLVLRGDLRDFPFRKKGSGKFDLTMNVIDGRLKYGPDWPPLRDVTGRISLRDGGLDAEVKRGRIYKMPVHFATAKIRDFRKPLLMIDGRLSGAGQDTVRFLNESPIGARIDGFTERTKISGDADTRIKLMLPLRNFDEFVLEGSTTLKGASVALTDFLPEFGNVSGVVNFSHNGLAFDKLTARTLGGQVILNARSPVRGQLEIRARGKLSAAGLRAFTDNPVTRQFDGSTNYDLRLDINRGVLKLNAESRLRGLASRLPPPFNKRAKSTRRLRVELKPLNRRRGRGDLIRVLVGDDAQLVIARAREKRADRLRVRAATVAVGANPILPADGLTVAVHDRPVDVDAWWRFLTREVLNQKGPAKVPGFFAGFDLRPSRISALVPTAVVNGKTYSNVIAGATRDKSRWHLNAKTAEVDGYMAWLPAGPSRLEATVVGRFDRLEIPSSAADEIKRASRSTLTGLPALDIEADQFILGAKALGRFKLRARNLDASGGWQIDHLSIESAAARLASSGIWKPDSSGVPTARLDLDLDVRDSGSLLKTLGFPDTINRGAGKLNGQLHWQGSPLAIDLPSLGGKIGLALGRGQFLKTEPGIAKLIGVLSMQSLARRLSLDFSDVFEKGFAFDAIVGEVDIRNGVASTKNFLMQGVQAQVLINGTANTVKESQELRVEVLPNVNAGLASIAYAAIANPAVGIGSLVAQMLLETPLRRVFGYEFEVTGPWVEPVVKQLNVPNLNETGNGENVSG